MSITDRIIDWIELGRVPDFLVRRGIRYLCRKRLAHVDQGDCEKNQRRLEQLVESLSAGPIAALPEKANEQHYEVPAEFFELVLGKRRKYSCCYYPSAKTTLDAAEELALKETCKRAEIGDGMSILELGCGWGSLTLWLAAQYPNAKITAVSNSHSQREFILGQAEKLGVDKNLTVITCDMNEFELDAKFDRVVSVEMFEHMRNYDRLLSNVAGWLEDDGKLFVHIFCHREFTYEFNDEGSDDWMSRYFFSGGIMPGEGLFGRFAKDMKITKQWRWSGIHYHRTSEDWLSNMDANQDDVMQIFEACYEKFEAKRWFNRWRLFFLAVSELFKADNGQQWFVSHYLFDKAAAVGKRSTSTVKVHRLS